MANKTATLYINVKQADGKWKFLRPVTKGNGRLKQGWALADETPTQFADFNYYVSWYENGKKRFELCGKDTDVAVAAVSRREKSLEAKAEGLTVLDQKESKGRVLLSAAIAVYVDDAADGKKARKTYSARKRTMELFADSCNKTFVDQIDLRDMLNFKSHLRKAGFADRTIFNHFETANSFLRANGVISASGKSIVPSHDWPEFDEKPAKKYQQEELATLFKAADKMETAVFKFFLTSGGREGEVARLQWRDLDMRMKKAEFASRQGASTKNRKSRSVPLPDSMIAILKDHQKEYGDSLYVFPNQSGGMEGHWLRRLQKLALRAGLNCGRCKDVGEGGEKNCKEHAVCQEWGLHRFRKTFATNHLHNGANIRQIQKWLGHHSLDVTINYLADEDDTSDPVRDQVNDAFAAFV
jgi:integrase/recombinase XerD